MERDRSAMRFGFFVVMELYNEKKWITSIKSRMNVKPCPYEVGNTVFIL